MADSRRLFVVLAVIAVFSASAFAQTQFTCVGNQNTNAQVRGGGLTELVGDVVLACSGGTGGTIQPPASFAAQITGGATAVTNRLGARDVVANTYEISAVLTVTDVSGNTLQVVKGNLQANAQNIVLFPNVVVPTGTNSNIRIRNIRVATNPVTSTTSTVPIYATVSTTGGQVPITNPLEQVATVYPTLVFNVTNCNGSGSPSLAYQQCISQPTAGAGALSFAVRFTEQIMPTAFKTVAQEVSQVPSVTGPGTYTYNGTTVVAGATITSMADVADHGTRLILQVSNVPAGVTIRVTDREIATATGITGSTPLAKANLVVGALATGRGGDVSTVPDTLEGTTATCGSTLHNTDGTGTANEVHLVDAETSGGDVYAVWEVVGDDPGLVDQLMFGVQITFEADPGADIPALSTSAGVVEGQYAPISTVAAAHATAEIPRFSNNPINGGPVFSIGPCVTNLLFPYVTGTNGFATGIAIANTSKDNVSTGSDLPVPFNTSSQTGTCTLYFFGENAIDPFTTADPVEPGTVYTVAANDLAPAFQGYVIARCNFQYAHGLAFLTAGGSFSEYLALVIPDRAGNRPPDPFTEAGIGSGEQLGY